MRIRNSKRFEAVKEFISRGGTVKPDGIAYGIRGRRIKGWVKGGYVHTSIKMSGEVVGFPFHQVVAFLKFGEEALARAECVRHLDGDSTNNAWENIAIGTHSENAMDKPKHIRSEMARRATENVGLSSEVWEQVKKDHNEGMSYRKLMKKYGISSKGTIAYRLSKTAKHKAK